MHLLSHSFGLIILAYKERRHIVKLKRSSLLMKTLNLFYSEGLIRGYSLSDDLKNIFVFLKYYEEKPLIYGFKTFSVGRKHFYIDNNNFSKYITSNGLFVISTNQYGLIFSTRLFRKNLSLFSNKCGGKLLFQIFI